ncbi:CobW family GTP-binding protein [Marinobacterium ramblicola]|uniref:CobW family GTP-binding protein n=1 Tax=Marinobacterium ramblicola TaxID=2849041 RepID=UPI0031BA083C
MVAINIIKSVPTNIITGFLGAGKTTAINHLLSHKPASERWAVLVNEFGQIGVDQSLIDNDDRVQIQEIPGGCLCCARGPQLRVVLTRLLRSARPDRLIIEPTGLGHPLGIVDLLLGPDFAGVIDLRSMICLIDPRVLEQPEILANPVFGDQINLADILVLNKADLCSPEQLNEALTLSHNMFPPKQQVLTTRMGELDTGLLDSVRSTPTTGARPLLRPNTSTTMMEQEAQEPASAPGQPVQFKGEMGGFHSQSWLFHADDCFDSARVLEFLDHQQDSLRIKAAIRIGHGWIGYNRMLKDRSVTQLAWRRDSRIELLSTQPLDMEELSLKLQNCLKS